jgi:hypothetical protein
MARRGPTLVYVHGAGAQPPEADWIRIHNQILFSERPAPVTDVAYYADLIQRFDDPGAAPSPTEAKSKPIVHDARADLAVSDAALAEASAAQQVLSDSIHGSVAGEGRTHEAHLFLLRLAAAMGPSDHRSRFATAAGSASLRARRVPRPANTSSGPSSRCRPAPQLGPPRRSI